MENSKDKRVVRKGRAKESARARRASEGFVFKELEKHLGLSKYDRDTKRDKNTLVRLTTSFLRTRELLSQVGVTSPSSISSEIYQQIDCGGLMLVFTGDMEVVTVSDNITTMLGINVVDIVGCSLIDFVHPCDHQIVQSLFGRQEDKERTTQVVIRMKNLLSNGRRMANTTQGRFKCVKLRGSRKHLRLAPESELCSVFCGEVLFIDLDKNPSCLISSHELNMVFMESDIRFNEAVGYSLDMMRGKSYYEFIHPADLTLFTDSIIRLDEIGEIETPPYRFLTGRGGWIWLITSAIKEEWDQRKGRGTAKIVCWHHTLTNLSEKNRIESYLQIENLNTKENCVEHKENVKEEVLTLKEDIDSHQKSRLNSNNLKNMKHPRENKESVIVISKNKFIEKKPQENIVESDEIIENNETKDTNYQTNKVKNIEVCQHKTKKKELTENIDLYSLIAAESFAQFNESKYANDHYNKKEPQLHFDQIYPNNYVEEEISDKDSLNDDDSSYDLLLEPTEDSQLMSTSETEYSPNIPIDNSYDNIVVTGDSSNENLDTYSISPKTIPQISSCHVQVSDFDVNERIFSPKFTDPLLSSCKSETDSFVPDTIIDNDVYQIKYSSPRNDLPHTKSMVPVTCQSGKKRKITNYSPTSTLRSLLLEGDSSIGHYLQRYQNLNKRKSVIKYPQRLSQDPGILLHDYQDDEQDVTQNVDSFHNRKKRLRFQVDQSKRSSTINCNSVLKYLLMQPQGVRNRSILC